jgi:hypothetical protein
MRKLIVLGLIMITQITFAQKKDTVGLNTPFANSKIVYKKTFEAPGKSTASLYSGTLSWFEKRYNDLDSVKVQDSSDGHVLGLGSEILSFKGPMGVNMPHRIKMAIDINAKDGRCSVNVSNIVLGYQNEPGTPWVWFTAEDLMNHVLGNKYAKGSGINPVPYNKRLAKKALHSLNVLVDSLTASINQAINSK